jgi:hypothetical protein
MMQPGWYPGPTILSQHLSEGTEENYERFVRIVGVPEIQPSDSKSEALLLQPTCSVLKTNEKIFLS